MDSGGECGVPFVSRCKCRAGVKMLMLPLLPLLPLLLLLLVAVL
jgi:hypothetical protein